MLVHCHTYSKFSNHEKLPLLKLSADAEHSNQNVFRVPVSLTFKNIVNWKGKHFYILYNQNVK